MNKFTMLEPTKLHSSSPLSDRQVSSSSLNGHVKHHSTARHSVTYFGRAPAPTQILAATKLSSPLIGGLPANLHVLVLTFLPIPDIGRYARANRATSRVAKDERVWERRWVDLAAENFGLHLILDALEARAKVKKENQKTNTQGAATLDVSSLDGDDDFGDFTSASSIFPHALVNLKSSAPLNSMDAYEPGWPTPTFRAKYIRAHTLLLPLLPAPDAPPHLLLASLTSASSSSSAPTVTTQARTLHLLARFLSPAIKPLSTWDLRLTSLKASLDRFDAGLLTAFDSADTEGDEGRMKQVAAASWEVWICMCGSGGRSGKGSGTGTEWEMGKVWAEKREVFYEQGKWDPWANFTCDNRLDFTAMDRFMSRVLIAIEDDGGRANRVFPPEAGVSLAFAERVASDVISEYIASVLTRARTISTSLFLSAAAACFREAFRVVDGILRDPCSGEGMVTLEQAEDVIYKMFETNMDDYLNDELEELKRSFERICEEWERSVMSLTAEGVSHPFILSFQTRFLTSQNPALVKRTVLASFTDVLLLPVTIVPRAVGAGVGAMGDAVGAIGTGVGAVGTGVVQGIAMLNPQRWMGSGDPGGATAAPSAGAGAPLGGGYESFPGRGAFFEVGEVEGEGDEQVENERKIEGDGNDVEGGTDGVIEDQAAHTTIRSTSHRPSTSTGCTSLAPSTRDVGRNPFPLPSPSARPSIQALDLLLSLDVSLQLIHAARDGIKRVETFASYPGSTGTSVREALEAAFCEMLGVIGSRHVAWGFGIATECMSSYKPAEHEETTNVAPLLQFFELVHVGDTIQSMVQVFFDKEMAHHIDKTDFLNVVVRDKKRFENTLDECVARGLNAGTHVLMNQVDHIILTRTKPRDYYPPEDVPLDGPTESCREAIRCLEKHCKLLKGSTSREILEVFYQEVGIRLLVILQKHIKRQIISLNGGFQVIADVNAYHAFIVSLKVPNITADFDNLKLLGHVFVVEDAKDLAQIVRDVTRYGGAYRPEDVYEFIQRRSDWKKIEKTVDKTMYNLSFKEDCVVCHELKGLRLVLWNL
ncbi:exocyst complex component Sec10-domain-containing protein [Melanogaster broomeanus]|nr:exocyst complex component Sec10-domain-containing protein [Melanogaster broomeanus]